MEPVAELPVVDPPEVEPPAVDPPVIEPPALLPIEPLPELPPPIMAFFRMNPLLAPALLLELPVVPVVPAVPLVLPEPPAAEVRQPVTVTASFLPALRPDCPFASCAVD